VTAPRQRASIPDAVPEVADDIEPKPKTTDETPKPAQPEEVIGLIELSGRVVVHDRQGNRHENEDGEFEGTLWTGRRGSRFDAVVKDGRWKAMMLPGELIDIGAIKIRSKAAHCRERRIAIPESGELDVQGKQSPISLDAIPFRRDYSVRARGYAWKGVKLTPDSPEDHIVLMDQEATLRVLLVGDKIPKDAKIRLIDRKVSEKVAQESHGKPVKITRYRTGIPYLDANVAEKRKFDFDGLVPGSIEVRIEVGEWFSEPVFLGGAYANLVEGETVSVEVDLNSDVLDQKLVPVMGTLEIHPSWQVSATPQITIRPLRGAGGTIQKEVRLTLQRVKGRKNVWEWDAGKIIPGRYEAIIRSHEQHQAFELPKEGLRDLVLRIGSQSTVEVTVLRPNQTAAPKDAHVSWHGEIPEGVSSYSSNHGARNSETGHYLVKCPEGMTEISASCAGFESVSETIDVRGDKSELTLVLKPTQGFSLVLKYQGSTLPIDWNYTAELFGKDGSRAHSSGSSSDSDGRMTYYFAPGNYTVRLGKLEGYLEIPEQSINIPAGETIELAIKLVREQ
jgi:hypothetical protein